MSRFTKNTSRQYAALLAVFALCFALIFAGPAESAQNSKNKSKSASTRKKNAKPTPTPKKTTRAKETSKKNSKDKTTSAKTSSSKNAGKKTSAKSNPKTSAKNTRETKKSSAVNKRTNAKSTKSNEKSSSRKSASKNDSSKKNAAKNTSSKNKNVARETKAPTRSTTRKSTSTKSTAKKTSTVPVEETPANTAELPQIIVTDVSARLRNQAKSNAAEVSRVKLGTVLKVTEKNPAWYRVQYSAGGKTSSGWISANAVNDLNGGTREELYRQIVERNYKTEMDFATAAELVDFMTRANGELGKTSSSAELELKRLLLMRDTLRKIPMGQSEQAPYRDFLKANEKNVVYSEPAGEWYVVSNLFWDLHTKYQTEKISDQIAWEAAQNPLPGECEGYINCHLFYLRMTTGEYLRLHPRGAKAADALKDLTGFLEPIAADTTGKKVYQGPTDVTDRAEFNNLIAELRIIVSRLPQTEKEKPLQQLKQIAEAYR